jgi:mRNA interferase MazF
VKRGDIYIVDLGPGVGREPSGLQPVVVVSSHIPNLVPLFVTVLPAVNVSDPIAVLGVLAPAGDTGFAVDIAVLAERPRTLDAVRFSAGPVGTVPVELMQKIRAC